MTSVSFFTLHLYFSHLLYVIYAFNILGIHLYLRFISFFQLFSLFAISLCCVLELLGIFSFWKLVLRGFVRVLEWCFLQLHTVVLKFSGQKGILLLIHIVKYFLIFICLFIQRNILNASHIFVSTVRFDIGWEESTIVISHADWYAANYVLNDR